MSHSKKKNMKNLHILKLYITLYINCPRQNCWFRYWLKLNLYIPQPTRELGNAVCFLHLSPYRMRLLAQLTDSLQRTMSDLVIADKSRLKLIQVFSSIVYIHHERERLLQLSFMNCLCIFTRMRRAKITRELNVNYCSFKLSDRAGALQMGQAFFINSHFFMQTAW